MNPYKKLVFGGITFILSFWPLNTFCTNKQQGKEDSKPVGDKKPFSKRGKDDEILSESSTKLKKPKVNKVSDKSPNINTKKDGGLLDTQLFKALDVADSLTKIVDNPVAEGTRRVLIRGVDALEDVKKKQISAQSENTERGMRELSKESGRYCGLLSHMREHPEGYTEKEGHETLPHTISMSESLQLLADQSSQQVQNPLTLGDLGEAAHIGVNQLGQEVKEYIPSGEEVLKAEAELHDYI